MIKVREERKKTHYQRRPLSKNADSLQPVYRFLSSSSDSASKTTPDSKSFVAAKEGGGKKNSGQNFSPAKRGGLENRRGEGTHGL